MYIFCIHLATCEKTRPRSCNYVQEDYSISFYRDDHPLHEVVLRDSYDIPSSRNDSLLYDMALPDPLNHSSFDQIDQRYITLPPI